MFEYITVRHWGIFLADLSKASSLVREHKLAELHFFFGAEYTKLQHTGLSLFSDHQIFLQCRESVCCS